MTRTRTVTDRLVVALIVTLFAVLTVATTPAHASGHGPCANGAKPVTDMQTGESVCPVVVGQPATPGADPVRGQPWTPPPGYVRVEWSSGGSEDDGTPCIERHSRWIPEEDRPGYLDAYHRGFFRWYESLDYDLLGTLTDCSTQPGAPAINPEMVRGMIISRLPLPAPSIEPGRAITGLRSYLDVGAPVTFGDPEVRAEGLPIVIAVSATGQYRVDWGDGTVLTYSSSGGPYPDGDITHVYTDAGDYTVTVTPVWSVSWSGGGFDITFATELAPATVDLPVEEVRAVRTD